MDQKRFNVDFLGQSYNCWYVTEIGLAEELIAQLMEKDCLFGIDTETAPYEKYKNYPEAGLSPHLSAIRLLQLCDGRNSIVFDVRALGGLDFALHFLETKRFVAHNALFDLQYFIKAGVKGMKLGCTRILAKLLFHAIYPDDSGLDASLGGLAEKVLKTEVFKKMQKSDWAEPDLTFEQIEYAALDAICVLKLAEKLAPGLKKFGMERIYTLNKDAQHPIAEMQLNGMKLDVEKHRKLIDVWRDRAHKAKIQVTKLTGIQDISSKTIGDWLSKNLEKDVLSIWPRTPGGALGTDAHTFADFSWVTIVKPLLEYQKTTTLCSTFGTKLIAKVNPETGRIHTKYNICGARTGRLSSSQPNLQNMPRDKEVRSIFIAEEGHTLLIADYSQIELRVAAELSRDKTMLEAYREGIDLHALTASRIAHKELKAVTKEERQIAKAFNFGLLFGLGKTKFSHYARKSYGIEITEEEAEESIDVFRDTYAGYREWQLEQAENAAFSMLCRTPTGKLRKLPKDNTFGNSMNHPVQGGAAEIMLSALIRLHKSLPESCKLLNTVHDEIIIEIPYKGFNWRIGVDCMQECMMRGFVDIFPNGILQDLVGIGQGRSWADK